MISTPASEDGHHRYGVCVQRHVEGDGVPHPFAPKRWLPAGRAPRSGQGRAGRAGVAAIFGSMAACGWCRCRAALALRAVGGSRWGRRGAAPGEAGCDMGSPDRGGGGGWRGPGSPEARSLRKCFTLSCCR